MPRAKAVCVIRRGDAVLLIHGYDEVRDVRFFIPPGGGVEFREHSSEAAVREVREEFGAEVVDVELLGIFENIFEYRGRPEHEIVFAYSASFEDAALYERERFDGVESNHVPLVAEWVPLESFSGPGRVLFPEGLLARLTGEA